MDAAPQVPALASVMTREVISVDPDATVQAVARLLTRHHVSAVPVCDQHGALMGIISEGDLLLPFGKAHELRRDWWLGLLADGTELAPDFLAYLHDDHRCARDLMTTPVHCVNEDASLAEVGDILTRFRIKRVPVMRAGKVVGIVSRADLVRAFFAIAAPFAIAAAPRAPAP